MEMKMKEHTEDYTSSVQNYDAYSCLKGSLTPWWQTLIFDSFEPIIINLSPFDLNQTF